MQEKNQDIQGLVASIEHSLNWGNSAGWSSYDYEKLSELILEKTKTSISSNTLKRVWGRITYSSKPSDVTLNTLSQFLGYDDFRGFLATIKEKSLPVEVKKKSKKSTRSFWPPFGARPAVIFSAGAIFMLIAIIVMSYTFAKKNIDPDNYYFTSRKVTEGLPNSVIFEYRAKDAPAGAKVEIQQNWDTRKRQEVSITDSLATAIYYHPGFFKAKLVVGDQIVKEHDILIPSDGWCATTERGGRPLYFEQSEIAMDTAVAVSKELLLQNGVDAKLSGVKVNYRWVENFDGLRIDDLNFSVTIKNDVNGGQNVCQKTSIILLLEGQVISIPLAKLGCMSELGLWFFDRTISGKNRDMSNFGVDFSDWVKVDCISKNNDLVLFVNGEEAISLPLAGKINKFYGVSISFEGTGSIKNLNVSNSKRTYLTLDYAKSIQTSLDANFNDN